MSERISLTAEIIETVTQIDVREPQVLILKPRELSEDESLERLFLRG